MRRKVSHSCRGLIINKVGNGTIIGLNVTDCRRGICVLYMEHLGGRWTINFIGTTGGGIPVKVIFGYVFMK